MKFIPFFPIFGLAVTVAVANLPTAVPIDSSPFPFREKQPDGTFTPILRIRGSTKIHYLSDANGYTIMEDEKRWFVYAYLDERTGTLKSSGLRVGQGDPARKKGLKPKIVPKKLSAFIDDNDDDDDDDDDRRELSGRRLANTIGLLKNLVILLRFSDHKLRTLPSISDMNVLLNEPNGDPVLAPTGSVRDVYVQNSYGKLTLESFVYPKWIDLPHTEAYYADNMNGFTTRLKEGMVFALEQLDNDPNFIFTDFDVDDDREIDAMTFFHSSYGAETGRTDCHGQIPKNRIWSHKGGLNRYRYVSTEGVRVNRYNFNPGLWGSCGSEISRIGVIAHELGHFLGLPDLYDRKGEGNAIGSYDMMSNSWGVEGKQRYPPLLSAWCKIELGWMQPMTINVKGLYHVEASATKPVAYRIDEGFPKNEYLLIENKQKIGFDGKLHQGGLAIWHIDENAMINRYYNDHEGYPGQKGWPSNGNHYAVALLQADGKYDLEKDNNYGDSGDLYHRGGVNTIGPSSGFFGAPFPNTNSYQGGDVRYTGIQIYNISETSNAMSFRFSLGSNEGDKELSVTFDGGSRYYGNMFDIFAMKDIIVRGMDIHVAKLSSVSVEIYTKKGSAISHHISPKSWTKIGETSVLGRGVGKRTPLPPNSFEPVEISAGRRQSFYVTLTSEDMIQSIGTDFGAPVSYNEDIRILEGFSIKYPFSNMQSPRVWNGVLHYDATNSSTLVTTFDGEPSYSGNMFDVDALNDIIVYGMDIHVIITSLVTVEIYTKEGSAHCCHNDPKSWTKIGETSVLGRGVGKRTPLPPNSFEPVKISANHTQSFYVTLTSEDMIQSMGTQFGAPYANNQDVRILVVEHMIYNVYP